MAQGLKLHQQLPQRRYAISGAILGLSPISFLHKGKPSRFPKIPWPFPLGSPDSSLAVSVFSLRQLIEEKKGAFPAPPLLSASQDMNAIADVHLFYVIPAGDTPRVDAGFVDNVFALQGVVRDTHPLTHCFLLGKVEPGFCFHP